MALNDVFAAAIRSNVKGEKIVNVLHFQQTSGDGTLPPNEDLPAAISEDFISLYKGCLSNDCTVVDISCRRVSPTVGGSVVVVDGTVGTVAQDVNATQSAVLATLYSDELTKKGRGRIFMGGVPDTFITEGCLTVAAADLYVLALNVLLAPIQGGTGATFQAGVWNKDDDVFHAYTSHQLRANVRTLRSRRMANP